jgi:N-acyl-phosphatidylethanolamine-hydrolysing phospholipase D
MPPATSCRHPLLRRLFSCTAALLLAAGLTACSSSNKYYDPAKSNRTETGFRNNYPQPERASVLKWQWERLTQGLPKPPANDYRFPVLKPDLGWLKANKDMPSVTWIGHATALLQLGGKNVLTDPMFSERASPFTFIGPRRKVPLPVQIAELPHIDLVVISHNHYDHLDRASVEQLNRQDGGPPLFLVPLGLRDWFRALGIDNVREMDWWDKTSLDKLDITFVPATHWSARSLFDRSETLWGGWVLQASAPAHADRGAPFTVYFAGDTGYSKDFQDIGARFPHVDLALIPIGAYAPRWFMQGQHVDPAQAVQIHRDVHATRSIGIHWGTFELADEPLDEPPQALATAMQQANLPPEQFVTLKHGETLKLER